MTTYFDHRQREVALCARLSEAEFFQRVSGIERDIIADVIRNTGDYQFPSDLRQKMIEVISTQRVDDISGCDVETEGHKAARVLRNSPLVGALHSLFHELASRRIEARFGLWGDNPDDNLVRRQNWEEEASK